MTNGGKVDVESDGLSTFFVSILYFVEWILSGILSFFYGLVEIIKNTFEEDISWPDMEESRNRFSHSFVQYQRQLEPFFETIMDQFPFVIAFSSFVVPIVVLSACITYCCSSKREDDYDELDAGPLQGTHTKEAFHFEGKRWFRQAECDFNAAFNDLDNRELAPEWTCIKCQQAAEKAIKACVISKGLHQRSSWLGGTNQNLLSHDLRENAAKLSDSYLHELSGNLQNVIGFTSRMRYPDKHPYPRIPRDAFSEQQGRRALDISKKIMDYIRITYF